MTHFNKLIRRLLLLAVALMACCSIAISAAVAAESTENAVKVAYLYNFAQFVDWPSDALPGNSNLLTICVLGNNPFGRMLGDIQGKAIKNRKVSVALIGSAAEAGLCQVLYISQSEQHQVRNVLDQVKGIPLLTISDMGNFVQAGGMIGLFLNDGRVQFEINNGAAEQAGLTISSHLLRLSKKAGRHD